MGATLVGIERGGMFLAMVVFQRHVGFTDCPGGRGGEGGVGARESVHICWSKGSVRGINLECV